MSIDFAPSPWDSGSVPPSSIAPEVALLKETDTSMRII